MRISIILAAVVTASAANAAIVTQWDFNSPVADANTATGTLTPNIGTGTASVIGITGSFASGDASGGSTDPNVGDDSGWGTTGYAAQGTGSGTRGTQYLSSTAGVLNGLYVTFDVRHSNTSSRFLQFEYTLDGGTTWSSAGLSLNGAPVTGLMEHTGGDAWFNNQRFDLFDVPAASDNANFGFRVTAVFARQHDRLPLGERDGHLLHVRYAPIRHGDDQHARPRRGRAARHRRPARGPSPSIRLQTLTPQREGSGCRAGAFAPICTACVMEAIPSRHAA